MTSDSASHQGSQLAKILIAAAISSQSQTLSLMSYSLNATIPLKRHLFILQGFLLLHNTLLGVVCSGTGDSSQETLLVNSFSLEERAFFLSFLALPTGVPLCY